MSLWTPVALKDDVTEQVATGRSCHPVLPAAEPEQWFLIQLNEPIPTNNSIKQAIS